MYRFDLADRQRREIYVSDPKALHHIIIKEQDIYEETDEFIQYVNHYLIFGVITRLPGTDFALDSLNRLVFGGGLLSSLGNLSKKDDLLT